jgi:hypothetical protein
MTDSLAMLGGVHKPPLGAAGVRAVQLRPLVFELNDCFAALTAYAVGLPAATITSAVRFDCVLGYIERCGDFRVTLALIAQY